MTLIVAKKDESHIYIVSDTMLTNPTGPNQVQLGAPEEYCAIKTVIINPFLCISFAGTASIASTAISVCRKLDYKIQEILNHLLKVNRESGNETEFIVCLNFAPYYIYEIKNSTIQNTSSAWIGLNKGFNNFQRSFSSSEKTSLQSKMEEAMTSVIESNVQGINGFLVTVTNNGDRFSYLQSMKTYMPARTYIGSHFLDIYGTAQEGGYSISIFSNEQNSVLAAHIRQNNYGIIFQSKDGGYLVPEVFKDVDEHEFNEITEIKVGIKQQIFFSSLQKSYFERGNKAFSKNDFEQAIKLYNSGISTNEQALTAQLYFNKGQAFYNLSRYSEGISSFNEAVKIDKTLQAMVLRFLSQFRR